MSEQIQCPNCEGTGSDHVITPYASVYRACNKCKGVGKIDKPLPLPRKVSVLEEEYERLKADSERLDKLGRLTVSEMNEFSRGWFGTLGQVREIIDQVEEQNHVEYDPKLKAETNRILDEQDWEAIYNLLEDSKRLDKVFANGQSFRIYDRNGHMTVWSVDSREAIDKLEESCEEFREEFRKECESEWDKGRV